MSSKMILKKIVILSHKERAGRIIPFHPCFTIVKGGNHHGKSCLIKSIYWTFGADPTVFDADWLKLDPIVMIEFTFNDDTFYLIRNQRNYFLNSSDGHLLWRVTGATALGNKLASLFSNHIYAIDKNNKESYSHPVLLFLPFYIDQDRGWSSNDQTFKAVKMFRGARKTSLDYWLGIKGEDYYRLMQDRTKFDMEISAVKRRINELISLRRSTQNGVTYDTFNYDVSEFEQEINELLAICTELSKKEDQYKIQLADLFRKEGFVKATLDIANKTLLDMKRDFNVAASLYMKDESIECPFCGTIHDNRFIERLSISLDEAQCQETIHSLKKDLNDIHEKIRALSGEINSLTIEKTGIEKVLIEKKGNIALVDIIKSQGKKLLREVFNENISNVIDEQKTMEQCLDEINKQLNSKRQEKRNREIKKIYNNLLERYMTDLDISQSGIKFTGYYLPVNKKQGSYSPRLVLAYYMAIYGLINHVYPEGIMPLIIDSPNQQDQDSMHLHQMLQFIRTNAPDNTQVIIGTVDDMGVEFPGAIVELTDKKRLLKEDEYGAALKIFEALDSY